MQLTSLKDLPTSKEGSSVTLGNFDGVHKGHQKLLEALKSSLYKPKVITFEPHPVEFFNPQKPFKKIQTLTEKITKIKSFGIEEIMILDFNTDLATTSAKNFLETICHKLNIKEFYIGRNFNFGKEAQGDVKFLIENASQYNYNVNIVEGVEFDFAKYLTPQELLKLSINSRDRISSSLIRKLKKDGFEDLAKQLI